jgi:hypothetical protein
MMKYIVLFCMILAFLGCATTFPVESRKDPDFKGKLESLYILIGTGKILIRETKENSAVWTGNTFLLGSYLAENLERRFLEIGIDARAGSISSLNLDAGKADRETEAFSAQAVMSIKLKQAVLQQDYYSLGSGIFDISIHQGDKTIWRSKITAGVEDTSQANRLIDTILSSLEKDGLMASVTPHK